MQFETLFKYIKWSLITLIVASAIGGILEVIFRFDELESHYNTSSFDKATKFNPSERQLFSVWLQVAIVLFVLILTLFVDGLFVIGVYRENYCCVWVFTFIWAIGLLFSFSHPIVSYFGIGMGVITIVLSIVYAFMIRSAQNRAAEPTREVRPPQTTTSGSGADSQTVFFKNFV